MDFQLEQGIETFEKARAVLYGCRRWLATGAVCALATWMFVHVMFGSNGMVVYQKKKTEYQALQKEIDDLNQENAQLQQSVKALQSDDPKAIEKEAREQLRYAKPGEVIYVMPEQQAKPPANAAAENTGKP